MTESPRRDGTEPTQPPGNSYPGYTDPAYANQAPYGPTYQPPAAPNPTERIPAYSPYGYDSYATGQYGQYPPGEAPQQPPPDGPKAPRWLWVVAAIAVVLVLGLVIALVIINSSRQDTVVAPLPSLPKPSFTTSTPTTSRTPSVPIVPVPTQPTQPRRPSPSTPAPSGATETVVYQVSGDGRAINITYVDTGGVLQTEFNVVLPWSKQVQLAKPAGDSASVSVINVGREVSCSISVNGEQVRRQTGAGLTICTGAG